MGVKGSGTDEDSYRPSLPASLSTKEVQEYADWSAIYYPKNAPYQWCLVRINKLHKQIPSSVKPLTNTEINQWRTEYYNLVGTTPPPLTDPAPESWNFDSDVKGTTPPTGWTNDSQSLTVDDTYYVSSPNSARYLYTGGRGYAQAGSSRTNCKLTAKVLLHGVGTREAGVCSRYTDLNNNYYFKLDDVNNDIEIQKRVGSSDTTVGTTVGTINVDTWYTIVAEINGWNARMTVGAILVDWTDLTGHDFASGVCGVRTGATASYAREAYYDDLLWEDYGAIFQESGAKRAYRRMGVR